MTAPLDLDAIRARLEKLTNEWSSTYAFKLLAEIERLRAESVPRSALVAALAELDAEHRPDLLPKPGCVICWPKDGSWPCVTRMAADELRGILDREGDDE